MIISGIAIIFLLMIVFGGGRSRHNRMGRYVARRAARRSIRRWF